MKTLAHRPFTPGMCRNPRAVGGRSHEQDEQDEPMHRIAMQQLGLVSQPFEPLGDALGSGLPAIPGLFLRCAAELHASRGGVLDGGPTPRAFSYHDLIVRSEIILDKPITQEYCTYMKRGLIKSFREYLNAKHRMNLANWRNNQFRQISREYGDYLYRQDRAKFDYEMGEALAGRDHKDWGGK